MNTWLSYATFISVILGILLIAGRGAYKIYRYKVDGEKRTDSIEKAFATIGSCKEDISNINTEMKNVYSELQTITSTVGKIQKEGSEGAVNAIRKLWRKVHVMNERLYRVEAHLNGGELNTPRFPEDDEEFDDG